jgi:hypothetical protein
MLLALALSQVAHAGTINLAFDIDPDLAAEAGVDPDEVNQELRGATSTSLKFDGLKEYLAQMANANSLATQGMGADYATNPQRFVVGASIGTAACGNGLDFVNTGDQLPETGFAAEASGMAGLNLGVLSKDESFLRRFVVSVNGMYATGQNQVFDWEIFNYGGHLQFKLIRPGHKGIIEWGGLDLTGGYQKAYYQLALSAGYPIAVDSFRWDASGDLTITSSVTTIPLEVSTNLRVTVFTVFGGLGLDLRPEGEADGKVGLGGDLYAENPSTGKEMKIGTGSASASETSPANSTAPRVFFGAQINILPLKIYAQANVGLERFTTQSPVGDSFGGQVGVRVAL